MGQSLGKKMETTEAVCPQTKGVLEASLHRLGWGLPGVQVIFAFDRGTDWKVQAFQCVR